MWWLLEFLIFWAQTEKVSMHLLPDFSSPTCSRPDLLTGGNLTARFPCGDGGFAVWPGQICDGIRHCKAGEDEVCLERSPVHVPGFGSDHDAFLVRIRWPRFACQTPLCVDSESISSLDAHILCREMGFKTYSRISWIPRNPRDRTPAIEKRMLRCEGTEKKAVQCLRPKITFSRNCSRLLVLSCSEACLQLRYSTDSGVLTSPGFPDFSFPNLHCRYFLNASNPNSVFVIKFLTLNLGQENKRTRGKKERISTSRTEIVNKPESCRNRGRISMKLGTIWTANGPELKLVKICNLLAYKNYTSTLPRILISYESGSGSHFDPGQKGFQLKYWTIPCDQVSDCFYKNDSGFNSSRDLPIVYRPSALPIWLKILIGLICFVVAALLIGLGLYYRAGYMKRKMQKVQWKLRSQQVELEQTPEPELLERAQDISGLPPLRCPNCPEMFQRGENCRHIIRMEKMVGREKLLRMTKGSWKREIEVILPQLTSTPRTQAPTAPRLAFDSNSTSYLDSDRNNNSPRIEIHAPSAESPRDPTTGQPLYTALFEEKSWSDSPGTNSTQFSVSSIGSFSTPRKGEAGGEMKQAYGSFLAPPKRINGKRRTSVDGVIPSVATTQADTSFEEGKAKSFIWRSLGFFSPSNNRKSSPQAGSLELGLKKRFLRRSISESAGSVRDGCEQKGKDMADCLPRKKRLNSTGGVYQRF